MFAISITQVLFFITLCFLRKKYLWFISFGIFLLFAEYKNIKPLFCLEICVLFNIFALILHNRKLKYSSVLYVCIVSIGLFLIAFQQTHSTLIVEMLNLLPNWLGNQQTTILMEIYSILAIIIMIGFMPFAEWIMYLFSISSSFFKTMIFITPMYLSLLVFQEYSLQFSPISFEIIGLAICGYSALCLIFNNNLRICFMHIMVYLYGTQILLLNQSKNLQFLPLWLVAVFIILAISNTFTPNRAINYKVKDAKQYFFVNKYHFAGFIVSICVLSLNTINTIFVLDSHFSRANTIIFALIVCGIAKIVHALFIHKTNNHLVVNTKVDTIRIVRLFFISICSGITTIYFLVKTYKIFITPSAISIFICFLIFIATLLLSTFLEKFNQPKILSSQTYASYLVRAIQTIKIVSLIIQSVTTDFASVVKEKISTIASSNVAEKFSNIIYGNHIYLYIFFLLQTIVVLVIECVIFNQ